MINWDTAQCRRKGRDYCMQDALSRHFEICVPAAGESVVRAYDVGRKRKIRRKVVKRAQAAGRDVTRRGSGKGDRKDGLRAFMGSFDVAQCVSIIEQVSLSLKMIPTKMGFLKECGKLMSKTIRGKTVTCSAQKAQYTFRWVYSPWVGHMLVWCLARKRVTALPNHLHEVANRRMIVSAVSFHLQLSHCVGVRLAGQNGRRNGFSGFRHMNASVAQTLTAPGCAPSACSRK